MEPDEYNHRVLEVDLAKESFCIRELPVDLTKGFIGGKGLAAKLLFDSLAPGIDPLSPENILIFNTGPLTGTMAPSSGRMCASSKSPLTGTVFDSHCGGYFGFEIRRAGYDGIIISGRAEEPVNLRIVNDEISFRSASSVWGIGTRETEKKIKEKEGKNPRVLSIGPAGENLVRFANIMHEGHRAFGRGGLGAVMGSKNLKAISVIGNGKIPIASPEEFKKLAFLCHKKVKEHPTTGKSLPRYGTPNVLSKVNYLGLLPTRNFSEGEFEGAENIAGEEVVKHITKSYGCYGCTTRCGKSVKMDYGRYSIETDSLEYETIFSLGSNLGNADLGSIVMANNLLNDLGMDSISAGGTISAYIESLRESGKKEIEWGDHGKILEMIGEIARKEGAGEMLSRGSRSASGEDYSVTIKGLELPGYDPRGALGTALQFATANRGGCHMRGTTYIDEILVGSIDRKKLDGKAEFVKGLQDFHAGLDSLVLCKFTARSLGAAEYSRLLTSATGMEFTPEDYLKAGERIFNIERMFNVREGFSRKDDVLPKKLMEKKIPGGPSKGMKGNLESLDEYYRIRGWDEEGRPTEEKLRELSL